MIAQRFSKCVDCGEWIKPGQEMGQSKVSDGWSHEPCIERNYRYVTLMRRAETTMLEYYGISMGIDSRATYMMETRREWIDAALNAGVITDDDANFLRGYYGGYSLTHSLFD